MSACQAPGCTREAAFAWMPEHAEPGTEWAYRCTEHAPSRPASAGTAPMSWTVYSVAPVEAPANAPGIAPAMPEQLGPLRRWRGLTWIGWLNYLALRWLFVRLHYVVKQDNTISRYYFRFTPTWRW